MSLDLDDIILSLEIGSAGLVSTFAAWHLGLTRVELLVAIFFTMTLMGQLTTAMLQRLREEI